MAKAEEKRKNCTQCNKSLKRHQWYYRNGKYFCNKKCFKKQAEKEKQESKG
jgi:formylmethanofuran dehydrogenase subunit E